MEKGFERYSKYTMSLLANHVTNKMSVLFADEGNAIYDIKYCFGISRDSWKYQLLYSIVSFYFVILTVFNLVNNWDRLLLINSISFELYSILPSFLNSFQNSKYLFD